MIGLVSAIAPAGVAALPREIAIGDPPLSLRHLKAPQSRKWLAEMDHALQQGGLGRFKDALGARPDLRRFLGSVFSLSPFLRDCALVRADVLVWVLAQPFESGLSGLIAEAAASGLKAADEKELMHRLRLLRQKAALLVALADLGGWWTPEKVTAALTDFADACLRSATRFLLRSFHDQGKLMLADPANPEDACGLIVLGMGKYGAHELNYSSDIDLILLFDRTRMRLNTDDPGSLFARFAKSLIKILQERTGEGYVFRVDLRLRPDPGSTPLAVPVEIALNYYEAYGQNWERAALIKARPVAGDLKAGENFLAEIAPFIWRRHLDFAAISDIHSIKRQIHAHRGHGDIAVAGHNIKLGRGGIREIEFFSQTQQLIAGGRVPALRQKRTIEALGALEREGWIAASVRDELCASYWYLRAVEHRIQMVADAQTHELPADEEGLKRVAFMLGEKSVAAFSSRLTAVLKSVERHYAGLFESSPALTGRGGNLVFTGDDDDPATVETLSRMGYERPSEVIKAVRGWHFGRFPAVRTAQARELLTELTPGLLEAVAATGEADATFFAFDRFLAGLPAGIQLFSLLKSNAGLLRLLLLILGAAPRLAALITRRPHVFDGLLDPAFLASVPQKAALAARLAGELERAPDYEAALNAARSFAAEQKFLIGVKLINRSIGAAAAGHAFSDLAEVLIEAMLKRVCDEFAQRHGRVKGASLGVLGMGRLGSRELTAGSDLDMLLLYDHAPDAENSDGRKPLPVALYFLRLAQRLIAAMSAKTGEGVIYDLDFRLRPSGNAGPLATHMDAFVKYQAEEAWTWERQALTRARGVAGDAALLTRASLEIGKILARGVEPKTLNKDVRDMRMLIDKEKATGNPFEVKSARGGFIDIEFIAQWITLVRRGLPQNEPGILAMLEAGVPELITPAEFETLAAAHDSFSRVLQLTRLCIADNFDPATAPAGLKNMLCAAFDLPGIGMVEAQLVDTQVTVRAIFERLMAG